MESREELFARDVLHDHSGRSRWLCPKCNDYRITYCPKNDCCWMCCHKLAVD